MNTKSDKPKTDAQRNAVHLWMEQVAQVLNDNGIEKSVVLDKLTTRGLHTQWTKESFKHDVYKPVFEKVSGGKESTEDANTTDHDIVIQGLQKWVAQEFAVVLPPFPDRFSRGVE